MRSRKGPSIFSNTDLATEIQRMRKVQTKMIPVITGATGTMSKIIQTLSEEHTGKWESMK